jgi:hypothetical protein
VEPLLSLQGTTGLPETSSGTHILNQITTCNAIGPLIVLQRYKLLNKQNRIQHWNLNYTKKSHTANSLLNPYLDKSNDCLHGKYSTVIPLPSEQSTEYTEKSVHITSAYSNPRAHRVDWVRPPTFPPSHVTCICCWAQHSFILNVNFMASPPCLTLSEQYVSQAVLNFLR